MGNKAELVDDELGELMSGLLAMKDRDDKSNPEARRLHKKIRNRTGLAQTKWSRGEFVAWDGEGVTHYGRHRYILLKNSAGGSLLSADGGSLSSEACFELLLKTAAEHPLAIHVIFAGTYDVNMMLQDLPEGALRRLWRTGRVYWQNYNIRWIDDKFFSLHNRVTDYRITLWDVWGFFQSSFVGALEAWGFKDHPYYEHIKREKARRNEFTWKERRRIAEYCGYELEMLVAIMDRFKQNLEATHIRLARWDGPGAIASRLYNFHKTHDHQQEMRETFPVVNRAAQHAYAGGRVEQLRFGRYEGPVYVYDINSAYPCEIAKLPSLAGAKWEHTEDRRPPLVPMSLYHVRYLTKSEESLWTDPLFWRHHGGQIFFPPDSEGWYWTPEVELARRVGKVEHVESWIFQPGNDERPFQWVASMYDNRRRMKEQGNPAEKVLKLGLNSLYGKMAQHVGWREVDGERVPPHYHQIEWAGYVTAATRAKLYDAAYPHFADIIGFETDSILATKPLDHLPIGPKLGEWSLVTYDEVVYHSCGVYWLRKGDTWLKTKFRGMDAGALDRETLLEAWRNWRKLNHKGEYTQHVTVELTRFQALGYSLDQPGRMQGWCQWHKQDREIGLFPFVDEKRMHPTRCHPTLCGRKTPADMLHETWVTRCAWGKMSTPYLLPWIDGEAADDDPWRNAMEEGWIDLVDVQ